MPDDALVREMQQLRADIRDDFQQLRGDMSRKADAELTNERLSTDRRRIDALEQARQADDDRKRADRRWIVAAILVPITIAVVQLLASLRGAA